MLRLTLRTKDTASQKSTMKCDSIALNHHFTLNLMNPFGNYSMVLDSKRCGLFIPEFFNKKFMKN